MVELIKQRSSHDCGIAAAAMAFGMTYEEAFEALRDPSVEHQEFEGQKHVGIVPEEFSWLAFKRRRQCCVVTINEIQPKDHWAYVWRDVFKRATFDDISELLWQHTGTIGILGVDSLNSPGDAHWVVVENGVVFDPSTKKVYEPGDMLPVHVAIFVRGDDAELDGTDFAHPSYYRGGDDAIHAVCSQLKRVLEDETLDLESRMKRATTRVNVLLDRVKERPA